MKGFDDVKKELSEAESPDKLPTPDRPAEIDINAVELSLEEANDIFENQIASAYEQEKTQKLDLTEDEIKEKVFGCDEDDFEFDDINIDNEKLQELLDKFNPNKWEHMSQFEKELIVKEFGKQLAQELGLQILPQIRFFYGPEYQYGGYSHWNNTITVNLRHLDKPKETLDTIAHETWHAYQHMRADNPQTEKDYLYEYNFDNYVRPEQSFDIYESQLVEAEARAFAGYIINKTEDDF